MPVRNEPVANAERIDCTVRRRSRLVGGTMVASSLMCVSRVQQVYLDVKISRGLSRPHPVFRPPSGQREPPQKCVTPAGGPAGVTMKRWLSARSGGCR
ncbi:hypothetical protein GCM10009668_41190 [Nocardioides dubius]|uniref:Uncharacterized protein n=1 Tax=Nocardioides dubius TaxID=317019 RepID=A0ABN1U311_9ACTN